MPGGGCLAPSPGGCPDHLIPGFTEAPGGDLEPALCLLWKVERRKAAGTGLAQRCSRLRGGQRRLLPGQPRGQPGGGLAGKGLGWGLLGCQSPFSPGCFLDSHLSSPGAHTCTAPGGCSQPEALTQLGASFRAPSPGAVENEFAHTTPHPPMPLIQAVSMSKAARIGCGGVFPGASFAGLGWELAGAWLHCI